MKPLLLAFEGDGVFRLHPSMPADAASDYAVGRTYRMAPTEERSRESHNHFFAAIDEAYDQLPEKVQSAWASSEELRKWALTHTAFHKTHVYDFQYMADAIGLATALRRAGSEGENYCRVEVIRPAVRKGRRRGWRVLQHVPDSQSYAKMGHHRFQASKDAVLYVLARELGIDLETLKSNAGRAA